ncbi:MAG: ABC transporter permease [Chloroflexota bacterium]
MPFKVEIERRVTDIPGWMPPAITIGAVLLAFIVCGIIFTLIGGEPFRVLGFFYRATFGSWPAFSDTLVKATPLIFVGLACTMAFKMKMWNIGAEGQLFMGAWAASAVVLVPLVPEGTPSFIVLSFMFVMGLIGGGVYGFIPGYLKARFQVNEIITTLMLNYVAFQWVNYWIFDRWSDAGFQMSPTFDRSAWLPRLADYARQVSAFAGITLHLGVVIALVTTAAIWWVLARSQWGYEIKLIGDNPEAARYAGVNIGRSMVWVMVLSGALAGLAGMVEVSGVVHRLQQQISPGYGFTGIIVAWLAKLNPILVIFVSILFGALIVAGREIQPAGLSQMLQGLILFFVISSDVLLRYRVRLVRSNAGQEVAA